MTETATQTPDAQTDNADPAANANPAAGTGDNKNPEGDGKQPDGQAPEVYIPEGLADHLKGKTNQEVIDNLNKAYQGARAELSKGNKMPSKLDDYLLDFGDAAEKLLKPGEDGKDPVYESLRGVLFENGIPAEKGVAVAKALYEAVESLSSEVGDGEGEEAAADWEYTSLGGADKAKPLIDGVLTWADGLKNQGKFDDADVKEVQLLSTSSEGIRLLSKMREMTGEKPIPINTGNDGGGSGGITEAQLQARTQDPKYWRERDPAFIEETTKMFKDFYGS